MTDTIKANKSSGSGWSRRSAVVVWLILLSGAASANSSQENGAYLLVPDQPVAREMRGGEQHTFQIKLNAGEYARVVLEQKGIDVVLALSGADGKSLLEV